MQENKFSDIKQIGRTDEIVKYILQKNVELICRIVKAQGFIKLDLSKIHITDDHIESIIKVLTECPHITCIDLSSNKITHKGIEILSNFLKLNQTLETVDLSRNELNSAGLKIVANMLNENQSIKTLNLSHILWDIDITGVEMLKEALKNNQSLLALFFDGNVPVGHLPYYNPIIASWFVKLNSYGDQIVSLMCEALKVNTTLKTLSLKNNGITDTGLEELVHSLLENQTLVDLRLGNNFNYRLTMGTPATQASIFNNQSAEQLATLIKKNKSLRKLTIARCQFGFTSAGIALMIDALQQNSTLVLVDFSNVGVHVDGFNFGRGYLLSQALVTNWNLLDAYPSSSEVQKLIERNRSNAEALAKKLTENQYGSISLNQEEIINLNKCQSAVIEVLKVTFQKSENEIHDLIKPYQTTINIGESTSSIDCTINMPMDDTNSLSSSKSKKSGFFCAIS